jgi:hypothetical protein
VGVSVGGDGGGRLYIYIYVIWHGNYECKCSIQNDDRTIVCLGAAVCAPLGAFRSMHGWVGGWVVWVVGWVGRWVGRRVTRWAGGGALWCVWRVACLNDRLFVLVLTRFVVFIILGIASAREHLLENVIEHRLM